MTISETKFRVWAKMNYPGCFLKKIPDFKQAGMSGAKGLPDFVMFWEGKTLWWEVKSGFGNTLNFNNHFTPAQKIEFNKALEQNVTIYIFAISKTNGIKITTFEKIKTLIKLKIL